MVRARDGTVLDKVPKNARGRRGTRQGALTPRLPVLSVSPRRESQQRRKSQKPAREESTGDDVTGLQSAVSGRRQSMRKSLATMDGQEKVTSSRSRDASRRGSNQPVTSHRGSLSVDRGGSPRPRSQTQITSHRGSLSVDRASPRPRSRSRAMAPRESVTLSEESEDLIGGRRGTRRLEAQRRRVALIAKWKRLTHFLTVLFGLWKVHARKVKQFMETNVDLLEVPETMELMFDVTEYKADKQEYVWLIQARVSQDTKRILTTNPSERTPEECRYVQVALANYPSIAEYPLRMTRIIAQRAWYEKYEQRRVVLRQGHPARCYYFLLNGSVVVTKMDGVSDMSRTVCFMGRGEAFGELGLVNNAPRDTTIISREPIELLVFNDEDYIEIFMSGGLKDPEDPFYKSVWFLNGWPREKLAEDDPGHAFLSYFKRGTVLVHNTRYNDWIFIVKSGGIHMMKKLHKVKPSLFHPKPTDSGSDDEQTDADPTRSILQQLERVVARSDRLPQLHHDPSHVGHIQRHLATAQNRAKKRSLMYRQRALQDLELGVALKTLDEVEYEVDAISKVQQVNDTAARLGTPQMLGEMGPFVTRTSMPSHPPTAEGPRPPRHGRKGRRRRVTKATDATNDVTVGSYAMPLRQEKKTIADELNQAFWDSRHTITEADINPEFVRIQTLSKGQSFGLSDILHDDQPALTLVSAGAECLLINKKFYMEHVDKDLIHRLRREVCPYPSDDELQGNLQNYVDWVYNRRCTWHDAIRLNHRGVRQGHTTLPPLPGPDTPAHTHTGIPT